MKKPTRTVLCGIGGFGEWYLDGFLECQDSPIAFAGFVDPSPERSLFFDRIRAAGTPIYPSLEEFYARSEAQLAIISSPIQFHCPQTLCALKHGSHVLCEKPLSATVQEGRQMLEAQKRADRVVAIGYQGSYTDPTQRLKADMLAGVWGRPRVFKCLARLPRSREYYTRNAWAGRIKDRQGRWVLDSPVNNAASHSLHHMLYLIGDAPARSAVPVRVEAGLYRAHDIENYDTAFLRCEVAGGAQVFFAVSHACARDDFTEFEFEFEKGTVAYRAHGEVAGTLADGSRRNYGRASHESDRKVLDTLAAIAEGRDPLCGIEAALSQTLCMNGAQESGAPVADIPRDLLGEVEIKGEQYLEVSGLDDVLSQAYSSASLPDSLMAAWAKPARTVELNG
jgi:predicted dehydrogenase